MPTFIVHLGLSMASPCFSCCRRYKIHDSSATRQNWFLLVTHSVLAACALCPHRQILLQYRNCRQESCDFYFTVQTTERKNFSVFFLPALLSKAFMESYKDCLFNGYCDLNTFFGNRLIKSVWSAANFFRTLLTFLSEALRALFHWLYTAGANPAQHDTAPLVSHQPESHSLPNHRRQKTSLSLHKRPSEHGQRWQNRTEVAATSEIDVGEG